MKKNNPLSGRPIRERGFFLGLCAILFFNFSPSSLAMCVFYEEADDLPVRPAFKPQDTFPLPAPVATRIKELGDRKDQLAALDKAYGSLQQAAYRRLPVVSNPDPFPDFISEPRYREGVKQISKARDARTAYQQFLEAGNARLPDYETELNEQDRLADKKEQAIRAEYAEYLAQFERQHPGWEAADRRRNETALQTAREGIVQAIAQTVERNPWMTAMGLATVPDGEVPVRRLQEGMAMLGTMALLTRFQSKYELSRAAGTPHFRALEVALGSETAVDQMYLASQLEQVDSDTAKRTVDSTGNSAQDLIDYVQAHHLSLIEPPDPKVVNSLAAELIDSDQVPNEIKVFVAQQQGFLRKNTLRPSPKYLTFLQTAGRTYLGKQTASQTNP